MFCAIIGGILVFIGLLLEKFADWMNDRFLGGGYKPHKTLELTGWSVLMFGIFIEIAVASWSANDAWQTRQMAMKNDLRSQPLTSATATARIEFRGNIQERGVPEIGPFAAYEKMLVTLCVPQTDTNGFILVGDKPVIIPSKDSTEEIIKFKESELFSIRGTIPTAGSLEKIDIVFIGDFLLPDETEVMGGSIDVEINSTVFRSYKIFPQKVNESERRIFAVSDSINIK